MNEYNKRISNIYTEETFKQQNNIVLAVYPLPNNSITLTEDVLYLPCIKAFAWLTAMSLFLH